MTALLIGDHLQLRPTTADHGLLSSHPLWGVSLFEKLITNNFPFTCLSVQHRMAPDIAKLLGPVYPHLSNHHSVLKRAVLPGFNRNVVFLNHNVPEDEDNEMRSKSNLHEASMIVGLAKHLIALGTKPSDMVLLSAYSGQLVTVREVMRAEGLELEADTLDNFQVGLSNCRSLNPQCWSQLPSGGHPSLN